MAAPEPHMNSPRGLYEVLITEMLDAQLGELGDEWHAITDALRSAEAPDRVALHLGRVIKGALAGVDDSRRVAVGVALARALIHQIDSAIAGSGVAQDAPCIPGSILRAVVGRRPDGVAETISAPLIPLLDTTLLTNAPGEPRVGSQLLTEIHSADRIDVVMAFIRRSGIAPLLEALRGHCQGGRELRVLTTTYTGSTEARRSRRFATSAPTFASRTTRAPRASTRRPGSFIAAPGSRRRTSARRT